MTCKKCWGFFCCCCPCCCPTKVTELTPEEKKALEDEAKKQAAADANTADNLLALSKKAKSNADLHSGKDGHKLNQQKSQRYLLEAKTLAAEALKLNPDSAMTAKINTHLITLNGNEPPSQTQTDALNTLPLGSPSNSPQQQAASARRTLP